MTEFQPTPCPTSSPWGQIDQRRELAPGIWKVSTPSHGGIHLSPERYEAMPDYMKATAYSSDGWYEEDVDWALVAIVFPEAFDAEALEVAHRAFKDWHPDKRHAWQGEAMRKVAPC